jgi:hypothetical protein
MTARRLVILPVLFRNLLNLLGRRSGTPFPVELCVYQPADIDRLSGLGNPGPCQQVAYQSPTVVQATFPAASLNTAQGPQPKSEAVQLRRQIWWHYNPHQLKSRRCQPGKQSGRRLATHGLTLADYFKTPSPAVHFHLPLIRLELPLKTSSGNSGKK